MTTMLVAMPAMAIVNSRPPLRCCMRPMVERDRPETRQRVARIHPMVGMMVSAMAKTANTIPARPISYLRTLTDCFQGKYSGMGHVTEVAQGIRRGDAFWGVGQL